MSQVFSARGLKSKKLAIKTPAYKYNLFSHNDALEAPHTQIIANPSNAFHGLAAYFEAYSLDAHRRPSGDYLVEARHWRQIKNFKLGADGRAQIGLAAGVQVEGRVACFPNELANLVLPLPKRARIEVDGRVSIALPEGSKFDEHLRVLTLPEGAAAPQDVPLSLFPTVNPDGSLRVTLPKTGVEYLSESNSLRLSNGLANILSPSYMMIAEDGAVLVALPKGCEVVADGSLQIPADQLHMFDSPPPVYVMQTDFCDYQPDGSCVFRLPEGASIKYEQAHFPFEVALRHLPIPPMVQLRPDGTASIGLPLTASYDFDRHVLNWSAEAFDPDLFPPRILHERNVDGSWTVHLSEGIDYQAVDHSVLLSNEWVNELVPDPVRVKADGSVVIKLPPGTEYRSSGEFRVPGVQLGFMQWRSPAFLESVPFAKSIGYGAYSVMPPEGTLMRDQEIEFPHMVVSHYIPLPYGILLREDGSLTFPLPVGTRFEEAFHRVTIPKGTASRFSLPQEVLSHTNPDGSISAVLPHGMAYDQEQNTVVVDNRWANRLAPHNVRFSKTGSLIVTLPPQIEFEPDGSFVVPAGHADLFRRTEPSYVVGGPDWVSSNPDGSVTVEPPPEIEVDVFDGTLSLTLDQVRAHFSHVIPSFVTLNADGSIDIQVPRGTLFDPAQKSLTVPRGHLVREDLPAGVECAVLSSGALSVRLPVGADFDSETGRLRLDNHWANQLAPRAVRLKQHGGVRVQLPPHTQHFSNGAFVVPAVYADFVCAKIPHYVFNGPGWLNASVDGSVHMILPENVHAEPGQGTLRMTIEAFNEHFERCLPRNLTFNSDGTLSLQVPRYAEYNTRARSLTLVPECVHYHVLPAVLRPRHNQDGSVTVNLPKGMTYDPGYNELVLNNYWANELLPPNLRIGKNGELRILLPKTARFHAKGVSLPRESAEFLQLPQPEYVSHGPAWVRPNPDGSFTVLPPQGLVVDKAKRKISMWLKTFKQYAQLPFSMDLRANGSAVIELPKSVRYQAADRTLFLPAGTLLKYVLPQDWKAQAGVDGGLTLQLPEGLSFNQNQSTLEISNVWLNKLSPSVFNFLTDGSVEIHLPEDTQFFDNESFVVSARSAAFLGREALNLARLLEWGQQPLKQKQAA